MKKTDFLNTNLPRHTEYEALRYLIDGSPARAAQRLKNYVGIFSTTADVKSQKPSNLLEIYAPDLREIAEDCRQRPDHYDDRQKELIAHLVDRRPLRTPATDLEKNELLLTFMRRSAAKSKETPKPKKEEDEEIVLEDGRTLSEVTADATFEKQDFGDIVLI